ncbi:MAG: YegP family protein [Bacteroidota bacterium]
MFEIYQSEKSKEFYFRLKAANGQNILGSEGYKTKASCKNGVASVQKHSADAKFFEKKEGASGKFFFNLKASNGQVIGKSQMYASESSRDNGIASVQKNAPGADVKDLTEA